MAYKPRNFYDQRDKAYPNQIAKDRPALATRIQCTEGIGIFLHDGDATLRGRNMRDDNQEHEPHEGMCGWFNEALRAGHAWRNQGDE